jgi:hypothetical protein
MATTTSTTQSIPTTDGTGQNWDANIGQALQYYQQQLKMDREQQAVAFASNTEAKGHQMIMAVIQNIR